MDVNKDNMLEGGYSYIDEKRKQVLYLKLFFLSMIVIIVAVLYYAYSIEVGDAANVPLSANWISAVKRYIM